MSVNPFWATWNGLLVILSLLFIILLVYVGVRWYYEERTAAWHKWKADLEERLECPIDDSEIAPWYVRWIDASSTPHRGGW